MSERLEKFRNALQARFPRVYAGGQRVSSFYNRNHAVVSGFAISFLVAFVAWLGINQHVTENTVTHIRGDVSVIQRASACSPQNNKQPVNRKQCEENFDTIIHKILTPLQACEFLEHGAPLIRIGGKPIPNVTCIQPNGKSGSLSPSAGSRHVGSGTDSGQLATGGSGHAAPEHQSTGGNPGGGSNGHHTGSTGGSHQGGGGGGHHNGGSGGNPVPAPTPTPEPQPEGPGASGGAGKSEESHASEHAEETPASETKLLPGVVQPVESTICGAPVAGSVVCK